MNSSNSTAKFTVLYLMLAIWKKQVLWFCSASWWLCWMITACTSGAWSSTEEHLSCGKSITSPSKGHLGKAQEELGAGASQKILLLFRLELVQFLQPATPLNPLKGHPWKPPRSWPGHRRPAFKSAQPVQRVTPFKILCIHCCDYRRY